MKIVDYIAQVLSREGVEYLHGYPVNPLFESAAAVGIRPIICRQERVGVGIADGYSRVTDGRKLGVAVTQAGPGAENAFSGVATAYSDSTPVLLLPTGHPSALANSPRLFSSARSYTTVTKWVEQVIAVDQVTDALRRAISRLRSGRPGPVMLELPADLVDEEMPEAAMSYQPIAAARSQADPVDVERVGRALVEARAPLIYAGQGILYAQASAELRELAELLQAPVMTTLLGKSAFPEDHPLALGTAAGARGRPVMHFLQKADVVLAVGTSLSRHNISGVPVPSGKTLIHATNDEGDLNKAHQVHHPLLGDAKLVLRQLIDHLKERQPKPAIDGVAVEIAQVREEWLREWMPKLTADTKPINPYRVIWELMKTIPADQAIVTHDSGSPREQMVPFYRAAGPRSYLGWGKSHGLGTGLGLAIGAKLAAPDKVCINWMGDAAFGMVGLDFETAVRCRIPIITLVSNNYSMAIETPRMQLSRERYRSTDIGGNYAEIARALGGHGERVEDPEQVGAAIARARGVNDEQGLPALVEFITSEETSYSRGWCTSNLSGRAVSPSHKVGSL